MTFVLGGARSGKSAYAEVLVESLPAPWTYIATAQALDEEMRERIRHHRSRRGPDWRTVDAPLDLAGALSALPDGAPALVDCLTLWMTNHMLAGNEVAAACAELDAVLATPRGPWFVVANEVGLGIVPENALARRFRDEAGRLNQRVAARAGRVILMVAGIAMQVKG